jgi:hypothetical protein
MEPERALRAVAVGMTPCAAGSCLLVRNEGDGRLTTAGNTVAVRLAGYAIVDPATGLVLRGRDVIALENPARSGVGLSMTIDTATTLR